MDTSIDQGDGHENIQHDITVDSSVMQNSEVMSPASEFDEDAPVHDSPIVNETIIDEYESNTLDTGVMSDDATPEVNATDEFDQSNDVVGEDRISDNNLNTSPPRSPSQSHVVALLPSTSVDVHSEVVSPVPLDDAVESDPEISRSIQDPNFRSHVFHDDDDLFDDLEIPPLPEAELEDLEYVRKEVEAAELPDRLLQLRKELEEQTILVGTVDLADVQLEEQRLEEERIRAAQAELARHQQQQLAVLKSEADARRRVHAERQGGAVEKRADTLSLLEQSHVSAREQQAGFRKAEAALKRVLAVDRGHVTAEVGELDEDTRGVRGRRYRVDWSDAPRLLGVRNMLLRAVKNKLPSGRYVMLVTLFDRLGGVPLRWSKIKDLNYFSRTRAPVQHHGRYYDVEMSFKQRANKVLVACPAVSQTQPGMCLVFELFQLRNSAANKTDKVVAWGAFPLCTPTGDLIKGHYKMPLLRGERDPMVNTYAEMERRVCGNLDDWLCNMYFDAEDWPRALGAQREFDVELAYTRELLQLPRAAGVGSEWVAGEDGDGDASDPELASGGVCWEDLAEERLLLSEDSDSDNLMDLLGKAHGEGVARSARARGHDLVFDDASVSVHDEDLDEVENAREAALERLLRSEVDGAAAEQDEREAREAARERDEERGQRSLGEISDPAGTRSAPGALSVSGDDSSDEEPADDQAARVSSYDSAMGGALAPVSEHEAHALSFHGASLDDAPSAQQEKLAALLPRSRAHVQVHAREIHPDDIFRELDGLEEQEQERATQARAAERAAEAKRQTRLLHRHTYSVCAEAAPQAINADAVAAKLRYVWAELRADVGSHRWLSFDFWSLMLTLFLMLWLRVYVRYLGQYLFLQGADVPLTRILVEFYTIRNQFNHNAVDLSTQLGAVAIPCITNLVVFFFATAIAWLFQTAFRGFSAGMGRIVLSFGLVSVLDPLLTLLVDVCDSAWIDGDAFRLYNYYNYHEGNGVPGVLLTIAVYLVAVLLAAACFYQYMLSVHGNARVVDLHHRLHAPEYSFFLPQDMEISVRTLRWILTKTRRASAGMLGSQHTIRVTAYTVRDHLDPAYKATTMHLCVYKQAPNGSQQLWRQFVRDSDGAIVELFESSSPLAMQAYRDLENKLHKDDNISLK